MPKSYLLRYLFFLLWGNSILFLSPASFCAQDLPQEAIGTIESVRGQVIIKPKMGEMHSAAQGEVLFVQDEIMTERDGYLRLTLLDETQFAVGPQSYLMLDHFIYNTATNEGEIAVSILKGVFRFVTGKVVEKDPEKMRVKLGVGIIGIRGTEVLGETNDDASLVVMKHSSGPHLILSNPVGASSPETAITEAGYGATVEEGEAPGPQFKVPDSLMKSLEDKVTPPGGDGGSSFDEVDALGVPTSGPGSPQGRDIAFDGGAPKAEPKDSDSDGHKF